MAIKEKALLGIVVAGNVVAAICGIIVVVLHVAPKVDTATQVIAGIGIVCAVIALGFFGCQTGRKNRILRCSVHGWLYWITWLLTIAGGLCVVFRLVPIGFGIAFCLFAAGFAWWCYSIKAADSSN
ncbi:unnamed protein product [Cuscuta epithymum]|uniref:Uncharacterized protein n=1 Tax=Cuscuta epithymum TaxID=186058 RepID=A0AAV0DSV2_9ASTE|nr:unnamed protein product [Cuscuta epithymum]